MERVKATRSELLALRSQITIASRGRDVLREKREQLMAEFRSRGDVILASGEALDAAMATGRRVLAFAEAIDGPEAVRSAALASQRQMTISTRASTVMGARIVEILGEPSGRPRTARGYAMAGSSARIDDVADRFEGIVDLFLEVANHELWLRHLVDEIRKTTRRVNALETVVIPQLERRVAVIRGVLDERERQDRYRVQRFSKSRAGHPHSDPQHRGPQPGGLQNTSPQRTDAER